MDETARAMLAILAPGVKPPPEAIYEIRVRVGQKMRLHGPGGERLLGETWTQDGLDAALERLTRHSLYAREEELQWGYLALAGGCRAGVCARWAAGRPQQITSLCLRVAHAVEGCAEDCLPWLYAGRRVLSTLVLSAPGLGKTTLLRDMARSFSAGTRYGAGVSVAVADERRELHGSGRFDLGPRTDVLEGCPKAEALGMLIRTMRPGVLVTDELGRIEEAEAAREAVRCGVALVASAHARDRDEALQRAVLGDLIRSRVFERVIVLSGGVGRVDRLYDGAGNVLWAQDSGEGVRE